MALSFSAFACAFGTLLLFAVVFVVVIRPALARRVLGRWAEEHGYVVQETTVAWRDARAYRADMIDTRVCFRIRVTDASGEARTGVAVAGYLRMNCLSPRVDVEWDEAPRQRTTG